MQQTGELKSIVLTYADSATMDAVVTIAGGMLAIARESGSTWRKEASGPLEDLIQELDGIIRDQAGIPSMETLSEVKDPRDAKRAAGSGDGSWDPGKTFKAMVEAHTSMMEESKVLWTHPAVLLDGLSYKNTEAKRSDNRMKAKELAERLLKCPDYEIEFRIADINPTDPEGDLYKRTFKLYGFGDTVYEDKVILLEFKEVN